MNNYWNQLIKTPIQIGCYLLKDVHANIIYIGKAKNLQARIKTHLFSAKNPSAQLMSQNVDHWDYILTNTEKEAFILEQNLIKKYLPRYNVILKDDRRYPYIYISSKSRHPRYYLIYTKKKYPGIYYGPFPDQYSSKKLLILLENLFPLKRCRNTKQNKPCLYYQMQQCLGGCWKNVTLTTYQQQLKRIHQFFRGKVKRIKQQLQRQIQIASENMQFEQAGRWKRLHNNIDNFISKQIVQFNDCVDRDFVNYYQYSDQLIVQIFFYRQGKLQFQTHHWTKLYNDDINETILAYLTALYQNNTIPKEMIVPNQLELKSLLILYPKLKCQTPKLGKKLAILKLIQKNCQALKNQHLHELTNNDKKQAAINQLTQILRIPKIRTIDFIDLSYLNVQELVVGVISRFYNGWEQKNRRIHFVWNNRQNWNEAHFFADIIKLSYQNVPNQPDLLLVDGSFLQLKGVELAQPSIKSFRMVVIGLIKNHRHQTQALLLPNQTKYQLATGNLLAFLSYIQDVGHFNAVNYFNLLKNKQIIKKINYSN